MSSVESASGLGFAKCQRLLSSSEFSAVFDKAAIKVSHPNFLILAKPNSLKQARLGLVIAKKNVRFAVKRNKLKRLIRESFRLKQHHLPAIDAIVLARRGSDSATNEELLQCLGKLWNRVVDQSQKL